MFQRISTIVKEAHLFYRKCVDLNELRQRLPLVDPAELDSTLAKAHALQLDRDLGFDLAPNEARLHLRLQNDAARAATVPETWSAFGSDVFQTPYLELRSLAHPLDLGPGHKLIDIGAAYGRLGVVCGAFYPAVEFVGYECAPERCDEGNRILQKFAFPNAKLLVADVSDNQFILPPADVYFIYDYGHRASINKTLRDLQRIALRQPITVVGRGRSVRDAIEHEHPWLGSVQPPRHQPNYSFYFSAVESVSNR